MCVLIHSLFILIMYTFGSVCVCVGGGGGCLPLGGWLNGCVSVAM